MNAVSIPLVFAFALSLVPASALDTNRTGLDLVRQLNEAFVHVAESVSPAVVVLTVTGKEPVFDMTNSPVSPDQREYWKRFHEELDEEPSEGRGSGIILRKDGFLLTNTHVVEDAEKIQVRLFDGRTFPATVRGIDPQSDVAILKIEADNLPVARLGDSSKVRVGEYAIAIGAPFGLDYSVTVGHISAKSRHSVVPFYLGGQSMDQDFLQTDANINPGNSGGPLVNIDGEVIGVNTLIRGLNRGIGFAIPINLAREIGEQLIETGKFLRPWLGIEIRALRDDPEMQRVLTNLTQGVVVRSVFANGPAAKSELRQKDVIVAVDGQAVSTTQQLRSQVRRKKIGEPVTLEVIRNEQKLSLKLATEPFAAPGFGTNSLVPLP